MSADISDCYILEERSAATGFYFVGDKRSCKTSCNAKDSYRKRVGLSKCVLLVPRLRQPTTESNVMIVGKEQRANFPFYLFVVLEFFLLFSFTSSIFIMLLRIHCVSEKKIMKTHPSLDM